MNEESYFNTVQEVGTTLKDYQNKARSQEVDVLRVIRQRKNLKLITPYSVHKVLQSRFSSYNSVPVDSIKRSFSRLKLLGEIEPNGLRTMGNYGRSVKCWKLR